MPGTESASGTAYSAERGPGRGRAPRRAPRGAAPIARAASIAILACALLEACREPPARRDAGSPTAARPAAARYSPHPSVEVVASQTALTMVARERETGAPRTDLGSLLADHGFKDARHYSLDYAAVDSIGIALRRPHEGGEPDSMIAVDGAAGKVLWERTVPDEARGGKLVAATRVPGEAPIVIVAGQVGEKVGAATGPSGWALPVHVLEAPTGRLRFTAMVAPAGDVRLAATAPGVVVLASRCSWLSQFDCEGTIAGLDSSTGGRRWSREIPKGSREVRLDHDEDELIVAVDGRIDVLDPATGSRRDGFSTDRTPVRIVPTADGLVLCFARRLEAVTRGGVALWARSGDVSVLGATADRIVLATPYTEEVIDAKTGERTCHRNRAGPVPEAWHDVPPLGAAMRAICEWPASPFEATIRGTVEVNGKPRGGVRVLVQGEEATTDAAGSFTVRIDAPGVVGVEPLWSDLEKNKKRPCAYGHGETIDVEAPWEIYEVEILLETRAEACPGACSPMDCE